MGNHSAIRVLLGLALGSGLIAPALGQPTSSPAPAPTPALTAAPGRQAVPHAAELRHAQALVAELCGPRLRDRSPQVRSALADELIQKAQASQDDPAVCYALLEQARELAAGAADGALALRACELEANQFDVELLGLQQATLGQLEAAGGPANLVAQRAMRGAMSAMDQDRPDTAIALGRIGVRAARRLGDAELLAQASEVLRDAELARQLMQSFITPAAGEATHPAPARARAGAGTSPQGRYLLFYRRDLDAAAAAFTAAGDPLEEPLRRQIAASADPQAILELAQTWWKLSNQPCGVPAWRVRRHAAALYARCLGSLSDAARNMAQKRIDDARLEELRCQGFAPGVIVDVLKGENAQRIFRALSADVSLPNDDLPAGDFAVHCHGYLDIATAGPYELNLIATTFARFVVDGRTLVDDAAIPRKLGSQRFTLNLEPGLHELIVDIRVSSGQPRLQLTWRPPGTTDLSPLPTARLYHEASER